MMKNKNKKGFTLLELLVVIFIIGLISSMLVVNWRKGEKQYLLQRTAQEIVQNIRKVQNMALTSWRYRDQVPPSYGIFFNKQDPSSYMIFADENGNDKFDDPDDAIETITIEEGLEIDSLSSEPKLHITFSLPDGFTNIDPPAISATITIKRTNGTCPQNCKNIIIINTGQINIE